MASAGDIIATTDADCILPRDWVERIAKNFEEREIVQLYGTVYPIEGGFRNHLSLSGANAFSRLGYHTRTIYFTLGCNTAFDREAFVRAGMYRCIDAGDDLEIAQRMRKLGKVYLDPDLAVGFSMRRYQQFGTLKSISEWLYIVLRGGDAGGVSYSQREYR
jgi:cellulose synthase/poly-beta-1,6-N-acetylglucosamine synthase-like glycosyltransferase